MSRPREMMERLDVMAVELAEFSRELKARHLSTAEVLALYYCCDMLREQTKSLYIMIHARHRPTEEEQHRADSLINGRWVIEDEEQPS